MPRAVRAHRSPRPKRRWPIAVALYLAAVSAGLGATWATLRTAVTGHGLQVGAWRTNTVSGGVDADLYTRAHVARVGLLALAREETMYFVAERDDRGHRLRSACRYRVRGAPPDARWWSITAYADDFLLFPDSRHRYSLNGDTVRLDGDGQFTLLTGPEPQPGARAGAAWLPTPGDRGLVLTLRLYNPGAGLAAAPGSLVPPSISPVGNCP